MRVSNKVKWVIDTEYFEMIRQYGIKARNCELLMIDRIKKN